MVVEGRRNQPGWSSTDTQMVPLRGGMWFDSTSFRHQDPGFGWGFWLHLIFLPDSSKIQSLRQKLVTKIERGTTEVAHKLAAIIVHGSEGVRNLFRDILQDEGYQVQAYASWSEALSSTEPNDSASLLIFLQGSAAIKKDGGDNDTVTKALELWPKAQIFITVSSFNEKVSALQNRGFHLLSMPIKAKKLVNVIRFRVPHLLGTNT